MRSDFIDKKEIILLITDRVVFGARPYQNLYGLRMIHHASGSVHWFDNNSTLSEISEKTARSDEWRFELRIRCVPQDLHDLYEKDKSTFIFYYDQVSKV